MRRRVLSLAALGVLLSSTAYADATFVIDNIDPPGEGLNDTTPVAPVGGNTGTTLGEQRLIALQYAADIWAELIDSAVPIVLQVSFTSLPCVDSGAAELGHSNPYGAAANVYAPGADPNFYYPAPLANRLLGRDAFEDEPDIVAEFNADLDLPSCLPGINWYYGLDGNPGTDADLVTNALHELGHGLGVAHFVDMLTGELADGRGDPYAARIFDNSVGKGWLQMTDAERAASATNPRQVVWNGESVTAQAPDFLDSGAPMLSVTPEPAGFSGLVGEANFGAALTAQGVQAELVMGNPRNGCYTLDDVTGHVVLLFGGTCHFGRKVSYAHQAGAEAVLIAYEQAWQSPPASMEASQQNIDSYNLDTVDIPALSITVADAELLETALGQGSLTAHLHSDPAVLVGADASGKVFLSATDPLLESSSISHWDTLARPNLLMEPSGRPEEAHHDTDLTVALLEDLGWFPRCGNGQLDPNEQCDDGLDNSDSIADACRINCLNAYCGDGVLDTGEQCDRGENNSDIEPNACREDCTNPRCGDGVIDTGEQCDQGADNSDIEPGGCRTDCTQSSTDGNGGSGGASTGGNGAAGSGAAGNGTAGSGTAGGGVAGDGTAGGGPIRRDGGTAADGAIAIDGGEVPENASMGGGGCGCRAAGRRSDDVHAPLALFFLLGLALRIRDRPRRIKISNRSDGGAHHG